MSSDGIRSHRPPSRWLEGGAPPGVAMLLQSAPRPRPRSAAEVKRTAALVGKIAEGTISGGPFASLLAKSVATIALATAVVGTSAWVLHEGPKPTSRGSAGPPLPQATSQPVAVPVVSFPEAPALTTGRPTPGTKATVAPSASPPISTVGFASGREREVESVPVQPVPEPAPSSSVMPEASRSSRIAEEARILESARAALASDPALALKHTDAHASQFPAGELRVERELLRIEALVRSGRTDEARSLRVTFQAQHPSIAYVRRLRSIFGEPETNP